MTLRSLRATPAPYRFASISSRLRPHRTVAALTVALAAAALVPASAGAQATRTWVSGVGDDANPCSRTAPCKTFAGAISKTAAGGEIDALDPGGFGALTITKSITIDGGGGQVASVLVAGTNGIVVAAAATDRVILRNLRLQGLLGNGSNSANAGLNGIRYLTGASVVLQNDIITGFSQNGVDIATNGQNNPRMTIEDTTIEQNGGAGVSLNSVGSSVPGRATVINDRIDQNGCGVSAGGGGCTPGTGTGVPVLLSAYKSSIDDNTGAGVLAQGVVGNIALGNDVITGNATGLQSAGGNIFSFGDNYVVSNDTDGTPNVSLHGRAADEATIYNRLVAQMRAKKHAKHHRHAKVRHHTTKRH
jgi:hypothetical protein